jgi:hypothetical protein
MCQVSDDEEIRTLQLEFTALTHSFVPFLLPSKEIYSPEEENYQHQIWSKYIICMYGNATVKTLCTINTH